MEKKPAVRAELLAPAGSREAFYGAVHAGADAVYLGGDRFSARAYADNFSVEEIVSCIRYAHLWGRKVYLTVNTLIKESEFAEVCDYVKPCYEAGLDGVIVQDIGVLALLRRNFPDLKLHASTQMNLTGASGAALLKRMGACRIVPARELSLAEIRSIRQTADVEVEAFIHGAMCYCYSGQCLFSSMLGERSGNRGRCAQPCRLPYQVQTDAGRTGECYPLSLKDLCVLEHIPKLIEAGIDSFKIEGRMKKPEYVAGVTAIYRKHIDRYYRQKSEAEDRYFAAVKAISEDRTKASLAEKDSFAEDLEQLRRLYIRSKIQDGYYFKHNGREMITLESPAYRGCDETLLAEIRQAYLERRPAMSVGIYGTFRVGEPARMTISLRQGYVSVEQLFDGSHIEFLSASIEGEVVQRAKNQPITPDSLKKQMGKLGDSIFRADVIEVTADGDAFYAVGAVNELRRAAVKQLEDLLIADNCLSAARVWEKPQELSDISGEDATLCPQEESVRDAAIRGTALRLQNTKPSCDDRFVLSLRTMEQLAAAAEWMEQKDAVQRIYIDGDLFAAHEEEALALCRRLKGIAGKGVSLVVSLPYIIRQKDDAYLGQLFALIRQREGLFAGMQVRNLEGMGLLEKIPGRIYGDAGLAVWNLGSLMAWRPFLAAFCLPLELTAGEQRELLRQGISGAASPDFEHMETKNLAIEKIIYGRVPMMVTANCVIKTAGQCPAQGGKKPAGLIDRYGKMFPVEADCAHCMNLIYNSVPLSLHGELSKWRGRADLRPEIRPDFRLDFTLEKRKEMMEILDFFEAARQAGFGKDTAQPPFLEYTTGHEKRPVM